LETELFLLTQGNSLFSNVGTYVTRLFKMVSVYSYDVQSSKLNKQNYDP